MSTLLSLAPHPKEHRAKYLPQETDAAITRTYSNPLMQQANRLATIYEDNEMRT